MPLRDKVAAAIAATSDKIELLVSKIVRPIRSAANKLVTGIRKNDPKALEVAKQLKGLDAALREMGLADKIEAVEALYAQQLQQVIDAFDAAGVEVTLTKVDRDVLDSLMTFDLQGIETRAGLAVDSIRSLVMRSVLVGEAPKIAELEKKALKPLETTLLGDLNTAMAGFNRAVTFRKADKFGVENFVYLGPLDSRTRDFCEKHVNKIYTRGQIEKMNNHQGLPVMLYGGGYNCRHRWQPISESKAEELLTRKSPSGELFTRGDDAD